MRAWVLTQWRGSGTAVDPYEPAVTLWPARMVADITGQQRMPPEPNVCIVEVECSRAELASIEADTARGAAAVLWAEGRHKEDYGRGPEGKPDAAEHAALRARLQALGLSAQQVTAAIGAAGSSKSRREVAEALRSWLSRR